MSKKLPGDVLELRRCGLVTAGEVARATGLTLSTVLRRMRSGRWPGYERARNEDRYRYFVDLRAMLACDPPIPALPSYAALHALEALLPSPAEVQATSASLLPMHRAVNAS